MGKAVGSRRAFSRLSRIKGTDRANSALLEPPEPIHPSAMVAARRSASGCPPPSQIGGGGVVSRLGGGGGPPRPKKKAPPLDLFPVPHTLFLSAPPPHPATPPPP